MKNRKIEQLHIQNAEYTDEERMHIVRFLRPMVFEVISGLMEGAQSMYPIGYTCCLSLLQEAAAYYLCEHLRKDMSVEEKREICMEVFEDFVNLYLKSEVEHDERDE